MMRNCDECGQEVDDEREGILNDSGEFLCVECQEYNCAGPPEIEPWPEISVIKDELAAIVPKAQRDLRLLEKITKRVSRRMPRISAALRECEAQPGREGEADE